jgi:predicted PurR-regulated permease PerM
LHLRGVKSMSAPSRRLSIYVPWVTLLKILAAVAMVWIWRELVWVLMLCLIAVIIAVALNPLVCALERRGLTRAVASWGLVIVTVGLLLGFVQMTWSSLAAQAKDLNTQLTAFEGALEQRLPSVVLDVINRSPAPDASMLGPYAVTLGRSLLEAVAAFVLAWVLVAYLLIEGEPTYRWFRGFLTERLRPRFDQTAQEAAEAARGYVVGNVTTSVCAALYFYAWLAALHVPAALLLALLAFLADFVPVVGFFLSCLPAIAMAATKSVATAIALVPIYLAYHVIENYVIAPRVYGGRLRLSNLAVLLAFAIGAQLGGVMGALVALPVAAVYPTIERLWLRHTFGDDVVEEHQAITVDEPRRRVS